MQTNRKQESANAVLQDLLSLYILTKILFIGMIISHEQKMKSVASLGQHIVIIWPAQAEKNW